MKKLKVKNMSNFQMSSHIDANKVFLISYLDLKNRWDPRKVFFNQKYSKSPYEIVTLGRLLQISPQYGANERGVERTSKNQPRYIRITDINTFGELSNDMGVTAENCEQQYFLNHNDLLIARSGNTVGKSYIHNLDKNSQEEFLFAGYMIRFIVNPKIALPLYVFVFTQLSVYKRWVDAIQRVAGQPNINAEEYRSLELPLPALKEQENITNKYTISLVIKQQKEQEAQNLLDSIDDYLMEELGIELPEVDNSLESRVFKTNFNSVTGNKWNATYHQHNDDLLEGECFDLSTLNVLSNGVIFQGISSSSNNGYIEAALLKVKNILKHNQIDYENTTPVKFNTKVKILQNLDIVSPFIGEAIRQYKFSIYRKKKINHTIDNNVGVIRIANHTKYNPYYICEILNSPIGKIQIDKEIGGGGVPFLGSRVKRFNIPMIDIQIQNKIVAHIQSIREQAKQLQNDAEQQFEEAKKEIEKMILGEN